MSESSVALFQILEYAGKLGILIAVITYFADYEKRRQADIRAAWSVVNVKGGGRKQALEYLAGQTDVDLRASSMAEADTSLISIWKRVT